MKKICINSLLAISLISTYHNINTGVDGNMFDDLPKVIGTMVVTGAVVTGGVAYGIGFMRGRCKGNPFKMLQKYKQQQNALNQKSDFLKQKIKELEEKNNQK